MVPEMSKYPRVTYFFLFQWNFLEYITFVTVSIQWQRVFAPRYPGHRNFLSCRRFAGESRILSQESNTRRLIYHFPQERSRNLVSLLVSFVYK